MVDLSEADSNKWNKLVAHLSKPQATPVVEGGVALAAQPGSKQIQRRFTEAEELLVIADYKAGGTVYSLAAKHGCHRTTISRILRSSKIRLANSPTDPATVDEIVRLYESGLSMSKVAQRVGVSAKTVLNVLRKRRIPTRDAHGRKR